MRTPDCEGIKDDELEWLENEIYLYLLKQEKNFRRIAIHFYKLGKEKCAQK